MGKHLLLLLLLLGLSLNLGFLQALQCHKCSQINAYGGCERDSGVCEISDGQCYLIKVYGGGNLHYAYSGCNPRCSYISLMNQSPDMEIKCCASDLCNKF